MFEIRLVHINEFQKVRLFYHSMIEAMKNIEYKPGWEKDVYPASEFLQDSINFGELFIGESDQKIAAAMVVNHEYNEGYQKVKWPTLAKPREITVIHALGVHPDFAGQGLAKVMVGKVLSLAKEKGQKVVRLDVLGGNIPAKKLYTKMGFKYIDTTQMYYEDTGWTNYELYEYTL